MINLLPDPIKKDLSAARTNTILLRYGIIISIALIFCGGVVYSAFSTLDERQKSAEAAISLASKSKQDNSSVLAIRQYTQEFPNITPSLRLIQETLPQDTVLKSLSIGQKNFDGAPLTLTVYAKSTITSDVLIQKFAKIPGIVFIPCDPIEKPVKPPVNYPLAFTVKLSLSAPQTSSPTSSTGGL